MVIASSRFTHTLTCSYMKIKAVSSQFFSKNFDSNEKNGQSNQSEVSAFSFNHVDHLSAYFIINNLVRPLSRHDIILIFSAK